MKILLLDDHPLFRRGIIQALQDLSPSPEVVESDRAGTALSLLAESPDFDCLFLDLDLPDLDGLQFLSELRRSRIAVPVIILSANDQAAMVDRCLRAGAAGYLSKATAGGEIAAALAALEQGGHYVGRCLRRPLDQYRAGLSHGAAIARTLTRRQRQVLRHVAEGLSNQEIAARIGITESTVKGHVSTLLVLFGAENRTQCARAAREEGLLDP